MLCPDFPSGFLLMKSREGEGMISTGKEMAVVLNLIIFLIIFF
jgi:hypothetical protein